MNNHIRGAGQMGTVILILFILVIPVGVSGQERSELERRKSKTQEEIKYTNKLLEETRRNRKSSYNDVLIIQRRINLREELINEFNKEIESLENKIRENQEVIASLENDLKKIRNEYEKMIIYHFKNRESSNILMYILASESFSQAYKRIKYIQQYTKFRRKQVKLISAIQNTLYKQIVTIEEEIKNKEQLSKDKNAESARLEKEKLEKEQFIAKLSNKERDLKRKLEEQKRIAKRLEEEILSLVEEEAKTTNLAERLTPAERVINDNFRNNKGSLPWPTRRGFIIQGYGEHEHPVLKGNIIRNNGIDIATTENADVLALFDGTVTKVFSYLGANFTVIIRHGSFLTVYQNLREVSVKQGDEIKIKQVIGKVYTNKNEDSTILHLEIWEEFEKHNPEIWLSTFTNK